MLGVWVLFGVKGEGVRASLYTTDVVSFSHGRRLRGIRGQVVIFADYYRKKNKFGLYPLTIGE